MEDKINKFSIGMVAEGLAIVIAVGFVISVIYDWGFFYALGIDFVEIPTTTQDHLRTSLIWFPYLFIFALLYYALEFQFQRVERGLTEDEIIEYSSKPEKTKKFREGPWKLIKWTAPLAIINYLLIGDIFSSVLPFTLVIIWMIFAEWCYSAPLIQLRRSWKAQAAFTFLPIIFILAFFSGYDSAVSNALRQEKQVKISLVDENSPVQFRMLRTFERGILLINKQKQISFLPWNQVKNISNIKKYNPFQGILSKWYQTDTSMFYNSTNTTKDEQNN